MLLGYRLIRLTLGAFGLFDHLVLRLSDPWGEIRLADEMLSQAPARRLEDRSSII